MGGQQPIGQSRQGGSHGTAITDLRSGRPAPRADRSRSETAPRAAAELASQAQEIGRGPGGRGRIRADRAGERRSRRPPASAPPTLNVMVFNIEVGGTLVSFAKVVEADQGERGRRRRHRRGPGPHTPACPPAGLALLQHPLPGRVEVPAHRSARRPRRLPVRRAPAGQGRRDDERAPAVRSLRALLGARRLARRPRSSPSRRGSACRPSRRSLRRCRRCWLARSRRF